MRFFHLADLHLGKRLGNVNLIEDQRYMLKQVLALIEQHRPEALLLAGDIYDKAAPGVEAVELFDEFLTAVAAADIPLLIISGNHDSPERLDFARHILAKQKIYVSGAFTGHMEEVTLTDSFGPLTFRLMPFVRPAQVRRFFPDEELPTYDAAFARIMKEQPLEEGRRYVLMAHQFITNMGEEPQRSESEQINVGGLDNIEATVFSGYSYVALGHIHRPQTIGGEHIRYAGSPLKYSFSEVNHHKSLPMVDIDGSGKASVQLLPITPLRDLRRIKGTLARLTSAETVAAANTEDYLQITLTDEEDLLAPLDTLRKFYPNVLKLDIVNSRSGINEEAPAAEEKIKSPEELFCDFYEYQQNTPPDEKKLEIVRRIFRKLEEGNR